MMRTIVLFALVALVVAEPPLQRFRPRAAFGVQRTNTRFGRLEEAPAPAADQQPAGYHYPKPTSSGYHYDKPAVPFPAPEPSTTEQAPPAETTTTTSEQEATTTESSDTMTTTAAYEDYEDSTAALEPTDDSTTNAQLRRRQPLNARRQQLNVRRPVNRQNQHLEELPTVYVDEQQQQQQPQEQQLVRPVYLINLPESTLQQLVLLNNAQLAGLQVAPQPTAIYLSELDYIYKKK